MSLRKIASITSRFIIAVFLIIGLSGSLYAQKKAGSPKTYTLIFKGVSLQRALQRLVKTTNINLVYDPAIMPDRDIFKTARKERPKAILRTILKGSDLDFVQLSSGTYVLTPAPRKPQRYGNLAGRVIDKRTGQPLAGANVMLADASGGAATDRTGHFNIPKLKKGYHRITISYVGYKPVRDTVWVPSDATTSLNFSLASKPILVEPIRVEGIQQRRPASRSFTDALHPSQITRQQDMGTADAVKSLNSVSGINFDLPLAEFNIQGGQTGSQQLRLDGVPIYDPVSMGQLIGAFSPWAIKKIVVHKAGFSAAVGSQLSGVVNMVQDVGDSTEAPFLFQANPLNLNGRVTQQFHAKDGPDVNLMVAARMNTWRWYQDPKMKQMLQNWDQLDPLITLNLFKSDSSDTFYETQNHSYNITYYDVHFAAKIRHNKFNRTRISAYFGKNLLETDLASTNIAIPYMNSGSLPPNLYYSYDHYNWTNYMAKIEHDWLINARINATFSGYITHHSFDHNYVLTNNKRSHFYNYSLRQAQSMLESNASQSLMRTGDQNALTQFSARFTLKYQASRNYTLSGGIRATNLNYRFNLSDLYYNNAHSRARSFLISGYVQNDFLLSPKTSFSVGSRLTFVPSRDLVFAEPRLAFKYDEPQTPVGYFSAKLAGGIYRQFINQFDISNVGPSAIVPSLKFWAPIDYTTTVPEAYHIAFESLMEPTNSWKIRVNSYYKWIPTRLVLNYKQLSSFPFYGQYAGYSSQHQFIAPASAYAYGASASAQKFIHPLKLELKGRYQYSISRQRIPYRFNGNYEPLSTSQPEKADISAQWRIISKLTLLMQWQSIWGRSWGFRKAYYDYLSLQGNRSYGNYSFNDPVHDRLPRYSQLNAGLSYQLSIGGASMQFRVDVFNLLNHKNVLNWWLTPYHNNNGSISYHRRARRMTGFRPSFSIKFNY